MGRRLWTRFFQPFATAAALLGLLSGCGGDGGLVAGGGIGGSGVIASGSITARGSIFVNGVEYDTRGARFDREGEAEVVLADDDSALQIGMVVQVEGALAAGGVTGRAERIGFEDLVEGPVESVVVSPTQVRTAVVLGQTVVAEQGTPGLGALTAGAVVEVSGFVRPDGSIQTTFIRVSTADGIFEVQGRVSEPVTATTFRIGALTVDFGNVQPRNLEGAPGGILAAGVLVEVKGSALANGILTATDVEVKIPGLGVPDHPRAEVEGLVADLQRDAATFTLNGQPVDFSGAAFKGGVAADLAIGVKVEAKGPLEGGILRATEVKFKDSVKLEGNVAGVDPQNGTLTLQGLSSIEVRVETGLTEFEDVPSLADIAAGSHLRIRGRPDATGQRVVRATQVRRLSLSPVSDLTLQGPVGSFDAANQNVVILGVTVNTVGIPDDRFEREDTIIGRESFFAALAPGILVKAQGTLDQTLTPQWREIELEE